MATAIDHGRRFEAKPARKVAEFFGLTALFAALVAAIIALAAPSLGGFARYLLIAECIGLSGVTCGTLLSRIRWLGRYTPAVAHTIISAVAVPVGYIVGSSLAYTLMNEPLPILDPGPRRIIALVATALGTVFVVYIDEMRHRFAQEAAARSEAQRLAVESQLRLLRAQLEPHMLFNTLANLRSLVDVDVRLAQTMIDQLIVYLRGALAASRTESTTLGSEFAQLRAYLEIMSLRMGPRLAYRLELPDELEGAHVPPMLLQPLVENAIKHGLEPKIGNGLIVVAATRVNGAIEIAVSDTGLGVADDDAFAADATQTAPGADGKSSYGLEHVRDRLRAVYGPRASLRLTRREPQGVIAIVRIPL
jgi:sensor histidine kinase YesM